MTQYINAGDIMTVSVSAVTYGDSTSDLAAASLKLLNDNLQVISKTVQTSGFMASIGSLLSNPSLTHPYLATLSVKANSDFNDDTDVSALVAHEIFASSGAVGSIGQNYPTVSVTAVNGNPTGEQAAGDAPPAGQSLSDLITNFFSGLETAGVTGVIILVGLVILILVLVAYGPNVGGVAKTAAAIA